MTGFLWFLWDVVFVLYVIFPGTTSKIYGSLAVVHFFFLWLYVSWLLLLYGTKVCYAIQYAPNYDPVVENGQYAMKELERVACRVFSMLVARSQGPLAGKPYQIQDVVIELKVPLRIIERALDALEEAKLIRIEGRDNPGKDSEIFLLASPENVTLNTVQQAVRDNGARRTLPLSGKVQEKIDTYLNAAAHEEAERLRKVTFAELKDEEKAELLQENP
jgi:membrane protein